MYHYIYQLNVGKKFYIGKRSSEVEPHEDAYYGSGKIIERYRRIFGTQGIQKIILETCWSEREAYQREKEIVTWDVVQEKECLNKITGGIHIPWETMTPELKDSIKKRMRLYRKKAWEKATEEEIKLWQKKRLETIYSKYGENAFSERSKIFNSKLSDEHKQAIAKKRKEKIGREGYQAIRKKQCETLGPEGRKAARKKQCETLGPERRKAISEKANKTLGPEGRRKRTLLRHENHRKLFFEIHGFDQVPFNDPETGKHTPEASAWARLMTNHKDETCKEWIFDGNKLSLNGYQQFCIDMGKKTGTLVRVDQSKPYSKNNCYWK